MDTKDLELTQLGSNVKQPTHPDEAKLEAIPNQWPNADYEVDLVCEEFTCICPITGQPDYAKIHIEYVPDQSLVESKSLKLYLGSYRNVGIFHEFVVNKICQDLVDAINPRYIEVQGNFSVRGGISIIPTARWAQGDEG